MKDLGHTPSGVDKDMLDDDDRAGVELPDDDAPDIAPGEDATIATEEVDNMKHDDAASTHSSIEYEPADPGSDHEEAIVAPPVDDFSRRDASGFLPVDLCHKLLGPIMAGYRGPVFHWDDPTKVLGTVQYPTTVASHICHCKLHKKCSRMRPRVTGEPEQYAAHKLIRWLIAGLAFPGEDRSEHMKVKREPPWTPGAPSSSPTLP